MKNIENETNFNSPFRGLGGRIRGNFVLIENEKYYKIDNYDQMQPFFISLASESDQWLYISSTGGLTAGRKNPDNALFPYYTDDKITDSSEITGSKTVLSIKIKDKKFIWEPFSVRTKVLYKTVRSIAKSTTGNKLIFTENNLDLGIMFSYMWTSADKFGFIRKSILTNNNSEISEIEIIDGIQNILPAGINRQTQNEYSTLVDAYKKSELVDNSSLAIYRMEATLVDRAEPSESLRANTVWSAGIDNCKFLLSTQQLEDFRNGAPIHPETESKGVRGAYFIHATLKPEVGITQNWYIVAELNKDAAEVIDLLGFVRTDALKSEMIENNIENGTRTLKQLVKQADGIQLSSDENNVARHFSNVLFNIMRGGIYNNEYEIDSIDFKRHVIHFNKKTATLHADFLDSLPKNIELLKLENEVEKQNDAQLTRLFQEYLPLTFSRRHGDPSRPWNNFNINVKDEKGNKILSYQGNWRDIFQNWEALSLSYPLYIFSIISKFLNATTIDGYNPYKITSEGIDWEVIEPDHPWANIGYWGDHQIIYLLKLLELASNHFPERFSCIIQNGKFAFANVPYKIKSYDEIVQNPKDSINFDANLHQEILNLEKHYGADARLVQNKNQEIELVSFTEKILVTLTAKLSNFIPGAGIWMNTLRPEWNDANNALVGTGASMVTLYYLRRFVVYLHKVYSNIDTESYILSAEIKKMLNDMTAIFSSFLSKTNNGFSGNDRRTFVDLLGKAAEEYRRKAYNEISGETQLLSKTEFTSFLELVLKHIDHSINVNKRDDNLYHAYNLVRFTDNEIHIRYLNEMLEGQVAILSSGILKPDEVVSLLDSLRMSSLYRADQNSYVLYPNKKLPAFLDKNSIPASEIQRIGILKTFAENNDERIIKKDTQGNYHFNADFNNAIFLNNALLQIKNEGKYGISETDIEQINDVYEKIFDHQSFTGRSGTFYKYEGLGCIYWHMVSKLLLAIGENIYIAIENGENPELIEKLKKHYAEVKAGIGAHKSPAEYGSFPFDPYSHTPSMAGVQQPGMTGQVKEDVINRFMELGVMIKNGCIVIEPNILSRNEFLAADENCLNPYLSFNYCTVNFIYKIDGIEGIDIFYNDGSDLKISTYKIPETESNKVFNRGIEIKKIVVHLKN